MHKNWEFALLAKIDSLLHRRFFWQHCLTNIYQMLPLLSKYIQFKIFKDVKPCPLMLFSVVILPRQTYNDPLFRSKGSPAHSLISRDFISPEQGYVNFSSHANKIWSKVMLFTTKDCHEYLIQTGASFLLSASLIRRSDQHIFVSSLRIFFLTIWDNLLFVCLQIQIFMCCHCGSNKQLLLITVL